MLTPLLLLLAYCATPAPAQNLSYPIEQYNCMKEAIYFEAGNQPIIGKFAVAFVILNRVNHKQYPNTVCKVVHQGPISKWHKEARGKIVPIRGRCQFSYWCDGKVERFIHQSISYKESVNVAETIVGGGQKFIFDPTDGATHYHATYVSPSWAHQLKKTVNIQDHIFYK
jgi:spore germination cell wall hydrolase CwlJ-like protein